MTANQLTTDVGMTANQLTTDMGMTANQLTTGLAGTCTMEPPPVAVPSECLESYPSEPHTIEHHTSEPHTTEPHTTEPHTPEPHTPEPHTTEPQTPEPHTTEPHTPKPHSPEPHTTVPHTTVPHTTEPHTTEPHTTEPHTTEPHTTEPHTTEPHNTELHALEPSPAQLQSIKTQRNQDPNYVLARVPLPSLDFTMKIQTMNDVKTVDREAEIVHAPTETVHAPTETVHEQSETVHAPTETVHAPTETVHAPTETVHEQSETVHEQSETVHGPTETVHAPTETVHEQSETVHEQSETVHALTETVHAPTETVHEQSETVHAPTETVHAPTETVHEQTETVHEQSGVHKEIETVHENINTVYTQMETVLGTVFDLGLVSTPVQLISLKKETVSEAKVDDVNILNFDHGNGAQTVRENYDDCNPIMFNQIGDIVAKEEGTTTRFQPLPSSKSETGDISMVTESDSSIMGSVVPEDAVLQGEVSEDSRPSCKLENLVSYNTTPASCLKETKCHHDTTQGSSAQKDIHVLSSTAVTTSLQNLGVCTKDPVLKADHPDIKVSMHGHDRLLLEGHIREFSSTLHVPEAGSGESCTGQSLQSVLTGTGHVSQWRPTCHDDPEEHGITQEAGGHVDPGTHLKMSDIRDGRICRPVPVVTDILGEIGCCTVPIVTNVLGEITSCTVPVVTDFPVEIDSCTVPVVTDVPVEIASCTVPVVTDVADETVLGTELIVNNVSGKASCETQNPERSESISCFVQLLRDMRGETVCSSDEKHLIGLTANHSVSERPTITAADADSDICCVEEIACSIDSKISAIVVRTCDTDISNVTEELNPDPGSGNVLGPDIRMGRSRLDYMDLAPRITVSPESLNKLVVERHKAEALCNLSATRRPASPLYPADLSTNNTSGCSDDNTLLSDRTLPDIHSSPESSETNTAVNVYDSTVAQSAKLKCDMVESNSRESDSHIITQPSTLMFHQPESPALCCNDPVVSESGNEPYSSLFIPEVLSTLTASPAISGGVNWDLLLTDPGGAPVTSRDPDYVSMAKQGDSPTLRDVTCSSEISSDELWLDTFQVLAHEEDENDVLVEPGRSPALCPRLVCPDCTTVLALPAGKGTAVSQQTSDPELPPTQSWSSSDSWVSALSDWFPSINPPPEDLTKTGGSGPGERQPRCPTAIPDITEEEEIATPASLSNSGPMHFFLQPTTGGPGAQEDRSPPRGDSPNGLRQQRGDNDDNDSLHAQPHGARSVCSPEEPELALEEGKMEVVSLPVVDDHLARGLTNECGTQLGRDVLWEETEDRTSLCSSDVEEEGEGNYGSLRVGLHQQREFQVWAGQGTESRRHSPPTHTHTLLYSENEGLTHAHTLLRSEPEHLTHTHGTVKGCCCTHTPTASADGETRVCVQPRESDLIQVPGSVGETTFIMPFAPVSTGSTFLNPRKERQVPHASLPPVLTGLPEANTVHWPSQSRSGTDSSCCGTCPEPSSSSSCYDSEESSAQDTEIRKEADLISAELSKLILLTGERFMVSEEKRIAYVTLDLDDFVNFTTSPRDRAAELSGIRSSHQGDTKLHKAEMPHKTPKTSSEGKAHSMHRKKTHSQQHVPQTTAQGSTGAEPHTEASATPPAGETGTAAVMETTTVKDKIAPKPQGKKKKKHTQHGVPKAKSADVVDTEGSPRPKAVQPQGDGTTEAAPPPPKAGGAGEKPALPLLRTTPGGAIETEAVRADAGKAGGTEASLDTLKSRPPNAQDDDIIKRRRIGGGGAKAVPIRTRPQLPAIFRQGKEEKEKEEEGSRRTYNHSVTPKSQPPAPVAVPRVLAQIQAAPVSGDTQSLSLWCQFSPIPADASITWTKEGTTLSEEKRRMGDDSRVCLSIVRACSKDLGMYRCVLTILQGSVSTSDYHLTSEVLMEFVIPSHDAAAECRVQDGQEENVFCSPLIFKDSILTDQYFGENQPASILTEKVHFGEGMHRKAFRATLLAGMVSVFSPGDPCVLKVHSTLSYGTKNDEELTKRNYNLAVEECFVQNTAREYIKAYTNIAKCTESFGDIPEIIPIYLVHRPSSEIPYATLEEELIGDFVKYSVRDGREVNLTRRDSESGQKCCTFQHWVYEQTDGNLLVTDMQGVGMKLTDVGIATCKKGYKGFKGNCSTSFIDQFKALHQCNRFCELLGLTSLQPKPKRTVAPDNKSKPQSGPMKQPFGSALKGKS